MHQEKSTEEETKSEVLTPEQQQQRNQQHNPHMMQPTQVDMAKEPAKLED